MKVIGVVSSPRYSKISNSRLDKLLSATDIVDEIYEIGYEGKISNSQALLLAAMWGANKAGADVEIVYPTRPTPRDFDGVILSTPVYFGDRSSFLHDFIRNTDLADKAVGIVSAGAKRNGGQETTNIYALYDCLSKGALITGNGPPTAQYGGTGWAGNKTAIVNDDFGIKTSYGTGSMVAKLADLIRLPLSKKTPNIVLLVVTKDKIDLSFASKFKNSNIKIVDVASADIKRCAACPVCPNGDLNVEYTCVITKDDMPKLHKDLVDADAVIFVSGTDDTKVQVFIERTRFIRRNHFEWSERVYSSISQTDSVTDILPIRIMTNLLRQNMFGLPFFRECRGYTNMDFISYIEMIERNAKKSITLRELSGTDFRYDAVGYKDATRDENAYRD